jgi:hypothetical protein
MKLWLMLGMIACVASAHVVVRPAEAQAGKEEKYTLRMPNEKQVATVSVELTFPAGLKVEWTGAEGSKTPASRTKIVAGSATPGAAAPEHVH